ncbi:MAG TPA: MASE1 domain-containing protein [Phenylobacterium sp.]
MALIYCGQVGGFALAYGLTAAFGLTWSVIPGAGTPIWPASGVALAVLALGGLRLWPGIFIGRILAAVIVHSPQPWWADILVAGASVLGGLAAASVVRRRPDFDGSLSTLAQVVALALASVASAVISGAAGAPVLLASGTPLERIPFTLLNWVLGNICGVLVLAPVLLVWSRRDAWRMRWIQVLHLTLCLACVAAACDLVFVHPPIQRTPTWYLMPLLIWAALAFNVRGAALALAIMAGFAVWSSIAGVGPFAEVAGAASDRLLLSQQFVALISLTMLVLGAVADERRGRERLLLSERRLQEERQALETLNTTNSAIAAELDLDTLVQTVTDAGVALTGARFGAFFYNLVGPEGESYTLFSLSGAPRSAFERFGMPRNTDVFAHTFNGLGVVRSPDITADPRYGHNAPHAGMPQGHLPVRSYLAVPVKSRSGEVIGGLFFGHPEPDVFTERAEWIVSGIAAQAAIALDNARLYHAAHAELDQRRRIEARQDLLINELNHRVKNTLATVQSIVAQTLRPPVDPAHAREALIARIFALSRTHDVITARTWEGAGLLEVAQRSVEPFNDDGRQRIRIAGEEVWLLPHAALAIAMALHELGTNAAKYGALSVEHGHVDVAWTWNEAKRLLKLTWTESGGPPVSTPKARGFGSRLIERGLKTDLGGAARLTFAPTGLICEIPARLDSPASGSAAGAAAGLASPLDAAAGAGASSPAVSGSSNLPWPSSPPPTTATP